VGRAFDVDRPVAVAVVVRRLSDLVGDGGSRYSHSLAARAGQCDPDAILMLTLVATLFHHMHLGLQVVIEDYIHGNVRKFVMLIAVKFGTALLAIAAAFAVLKVAFG
jgi:succinate dehydrogenase / fumarate reductase membrane anchor subunit